MNKSLLILGSPKSIYIKQYIINVLKEKPIDVFLGGNHELDEDEKNFFSENNVKYINVYKIKGIYKYLPKIGILFGYVHNIKNILKNKKFDYIHIHYVGDQRLMKYVHKIYKRISKKLILTFWGSDILDINKETAKCIYGLIVQADIIVVPTIQMQVEFEKYFGKNFNYKIEHILFGNPVVQTYTEIKSDIDNIERYMPLQLPNNKTIIAVGYNGSPRHNHFKILEVLNTLPHRIKDKIFILIQAGYGGTPDYIYELKTYLKNINIDGVVLENFIDIKETIALKKRVDVFIHGQKTDALSSSVLEYMLLDTIVLNPKWIQYYEWKALGIEYIEYDEFSDIKNILVNMFDKKITKNENEIIIEENFSWIARKDEWQRLYD